MLKSYSRIVLKAINGVNVKKQNSKCIILSYFYTPEEELAEGE